MANRRVDDIAEDLAAVVDFVRQSASGARSGEIAGALKEIPQRTLQRWLKSLVESGRLVQGGNHRAIVASDTTDSQFRALDQLPGRRVA